MRSSGILSYRVYRDFLKVQMPAFMVETEQFVTHLFSFALGGTGTPSIHIFHIGLASYLAVDNFGTLC